MMQSVDINNNCNRFALCGKNKNIFDDQIEKRAESLQFCGWLAISKVSHEYYAKAYA